MVDVDVLVAGAGPTGLTAACALRLHDLSVLVVDGASAPATTSRANFLHARGSEVLSRIGALGDLPGKSLRAMRITNYLGDRPLMTLEFGDPDMHTAAPPMVISQAKIEGSLRSRLAELGTTPLWGNGLTKLQQRDDHVVATLEDGTSVSARWVVGCDGTSSTTRRLAGIAFPGVKVTERWLLADIHLDWDVDRGGTSGWIHPTGLLGAMPMPDEKGRGDLWRIFAYDPSLTEKPSESAILDRMKVLIPERSGRTVRVGDAEWLSNFTVHRRLAEHYRHGRVLIAGDAAHAHAPFGGQGMLTGIGDAENLAFKLALVTRGLAADPLIDTYEAERRPLATEVLRGTTMVTRVNVSGNPVGRFLRDHVAARVFRLAPLQRWITYTASQLWVSYRKGPLGGSGARPRPGDRIGDIECTRPEGISTMLHHELAGRWALLSPPGAPSHFSDITRRRLGQFVGNLKYAGSEVMLVRPDGHMAWRGDPYAPASVGALDDWLDKALTTGSTR